MAIRAAWPSAPASDPTIITRIGVLLQRPVGLDDFRHGHAEPVVVHHHHLATRDEAVVDVDVDGLAKFAVEFHPAPRPSFSSWLTCIVALPSTALTVTGIS